MKLTEKERVIALTILGRVACAMKHRKGDKPEIHYTDDGGFTLALTVYEMRALRTTVRKLSSPINNCSL